MNTRTALAATVALLSVLIAACASQVGAGGPPPSAPQGGVAIVAEGIAFDRAILDVSAGAPFTLLLENRDALPHNVTIVASSGEPVFAGEIFGGPARRSYEIPGLAEGEYLFGCDVHPAMTGRLVARPV